MEGGQTDRAVLLLEDLYAESPGTTAVWSRLLEAYTTAGEHERALALLDEVAARRGETVSIAAQRGAVLFRAGDAAGAEAAWARALALAPEAESTYRLVANARTRLGLYAEAAATLASGADALADSSLFGLERANLWGLGGEYEESARLYLAALTEDNEGAVRTIQTRLARLAESDGALDAFRRATADAIARDPFSAPYREIAAWVALEQADYDTALDATRAADRLRRGNGRAVFRFAEAALTAGALDAADRALDDVLDRHGNGPLVPPALLYRARIAEARAQASGERPDSGEAPLTDRARDAYAAFARDYAGHPDAPEALRRLADLHLDAYRDADAAEATLDRLIASTFDARIVGRARLDMGAVSLQRGDLFEARERFGRVENEIRVGPLAEQARYELALIDFYEGYLFSALARAEAMDDNTAADVANDAVSLRLTLDENAGPDSTNAALRLYGRAALHHRRGLHRAALAALDSLAADDPAPGGGAHPLADEVLVLRAHALRASGDAAGALAALDRLGAEHPLSYFRDRALYTSAQIHELDLGDDAAALAAYGALLDRYPGSLLAPRARERLRALRQKPAGT